MLIWNNGKKYLLNNTNILLGTYLLDAIPGFRLGGFLFLIYISIFSPLIHIMTNTITYYLYIYTFVNIILFDNFQIMR